MNAGDSGAHLQVVSYNVRGLGDEHKCRHLINHFNRTLGNKSQIDAIIGLQETMIQVPLKIPYLWRGNMHLTPGAGNGRGCITLTSSHVNIIASRNIADRAHVLALQRLGAQGATYIVANIYAPNAHNAAKLEFFEEVLETIQEFEESYECNNVILLGDFNLVFNENEIINRLFTGNEKRISGSVARLLEEADLQDAWGERKDFTWRRPNSNTFSILDRVMYRTNLLEVLDVKANWAVSTSDHAAVEAAFKLVGKAQSQKRVNIPRLDPSLLLNADIANAIRQNFLDMFGTADSTWDPHLKLEFAKVCLRSVVEKAQADRKKREKSDEDGVNASINSLIEKLSSPRGLEEEEREEIMLII